jgi:iron complex outermembrane receptor protein
MRSTVLHPTVFHNRLNILRAGLLLGSAFVATSSLAQTTGNQTSGNQTSGNEVSGDQAATTSPAPATEVPVQGSTLTPEPAGGTSGVEEIVVTAQKREQNLQDVPISITALSQAAIVANRIQDVRDLSALAPSLTVRTSAGGGLAANYSMRGLVTAGQGAGSDKGISQYIDGVYVQSTSGSIFELADVERIEVLKGPQGTLFGRNATGGAISIITRNPSGEFGVHQELTYGNFDQFRSKTRVDLPRWGGLTASVIYSHSERRGDMRNLGAGTQWNYANTGIYGTRTSPKYLGNQNIEAFGATLKYDGVDGLSLIYKFDYTQNHFTPEGQGVAVANLAGLPGYPGLGPQTGGLILATIAGQPNPALLTPITTRRPDAVNNSFTTPGTSHIQGHNFTATYRVNDQVSIKNIFAIRKTDVQSTYQLDGFGGLLNTFRLPTSAPGTGPFGAIGAPFEIIASNFFSEERQISNETQLNIDTDWFNLTAGYIYFHDRVRTGGFPNVPNTTQFTSVPNYVIPANGQLQTSIKIDSNAWFLQPEIHLTDKIDLVLGARITSDRKKGIDNTSPGLTAAVGVVPINYRANKPTFLAGVNFKPTSNILVYGKYSTGYISGGQLSTITYDPETAQSYEAGIKADLFDRRLRANLAVYDVSYTGFQYVTIGRNVDPVGPVGLASTVVINGGNGKAKGFEFEATAVPVNGITLNAAVGYTDFKFTRVAAFLPNFLPLGRPKWTVSGAAQYDTPEVLMGGHLTIRGDVNYKSKTYLGYNLPEPQLDAVTTRNSFIVNGRIALVDSEIFGNTKAQVALWGRNLLDNRQIINVTNLNFLYPAGYERARTYGVDLSFDF